MDKIFRKKKAYNSHIYICELALSFQKMFPYANFSNLPTKLLLHVSLVILYSFIFSTFQTFVCFTFQPQIYLSIYRLSISSLYTDIQLYQYRQIISFKLSHEGGDPHAEISTLRDRDVSLCKWGLSKTASQERGSHQKVI